MDASFGVHGTRIHLLDEGQRLMMGGEASSILRPESGTQRLGRQVE
jgi:hypothetical protein